MGIKIFCCHCGKEIPELRLKYLPDTNTCVHCSETRPYSSEEVLGSEAHSDYQINMEDFENESISSGYIETYDD